MQKKYGFTHLLCSGWFGLYKDVFNKKYNQNTHSYVEIALNESNINEIVDTAVKYVEYTN